MSVVTLLNLFKLAVLLCHSYTPSWFEISGRSQHAWMKTAAVKELLVM